MKLIFVASLLLFIFFPGLTSPTVHEIRQYEDVILRLRRNGNYNVFPYAIFYSQKGSTFTLQPRGEPRARYFDRDDVIIDVKPLEDEVKPGVRVLARIGRNKYSQDVYIPARVTQIYIENKILLKPVCTNKAPPLGVTDDYLYTQLPDEAFKASSMWNNGHKPNQARLNEAITWCAADNDMKTPWLQIDLQADSYICSVTTKMYEESKLAVTAFTLAVSKNAKKWDHLMENNERKNFSRDFPSNYVTHFVNLVNTPYRYLRFYPVSYHKRPCMGVEVNGYGKVPLPPHILQIEKLRMEGSVCKLQNDCVKTQNAECNAEGQKLGTYTCRCKNGFLGPSLFGPHDKYISCKDIDECQSDPCGAIATCTNNHGSYKCNCKEGFQLVHGSQTICEDIDECTLIDSPCSPDAHCFNTDGSFTCQCKYGYQGNGYKCVDIDECNADKGASKCSGKYSECINSPGSYKCTCQTGFTGDGRTCTDANECEGDLNPCKYMNGKCFNNVGSYTCQCLNGYQLVAGVCKEIDECSNPDWNDCNQHATCTNKPGSYSCECGSGYTGSGYDTFGCLDIDECSEKNKCGAHSSCKNSEGSFTCTCDNGYTSQNGRDCLDIDECTTGKADCHRNAVCKNLPGSFTCFCPKGYTGKGDAIDGCTALSWCEWKGHDKCNKEFRHCDNTVRRCTGCKPGYEENNGVCQDVNECKKSPCSKGASCVNTAGSFKCHCQKGYLFNSKTQNCQDVDECSSTKRHCHFDAVCDNTPGSYSCKCKKGFDGDGFFCADTNECYNGDYKCPQNSACSNTLGSYKCTCKMGYHQSEDKCTKDVLPQPPTPKKDSKGISLLDLNFLWSSGSTVRAEKVWKLLFLSSTLAIIKSFV